MDQIIQCLKKKIGVQKPHEIYVIHIGTAPKGRFSFYNSCKTRVNSNFLDIINCSNFLILDD